MGRKKIVIKEISDAKARATTFQKRKVGLMKKAMEIAILCGADVALLVFNEGKIHQYSSDRMGKLLDDYDRHEGEVAVLCHDDLDELVPGRASSFRVGKARAKRRRGAAMPRLPEEAADEAGAETPRGAKKRRFASPASAQLATVQTPGGTRRKSSGSLLSVSSTPSLRAPSSSSPASSAAALIAAVASSSSPSASASASSASASSSSANKRLAAAALPLSQLKIPKGAAGGVAPISGNSLSSSSGSSSSPSAHKSGEAPNLETPTIPATTAHVQAAMAQAQAQAVPGSTSATASDSMKRVGHLPAGAGMLPLSATGDFTQQAQLLAAMQRAGSGGGQGGMAAFFSNAGEPAGTSGGTPSAVPPEFGRMSSFPMMMTPTPSGAQSPGQFFGLLAAASSSSAAAAAAAAAAASAATTATASTTAQPSSPAPPIVPRRRSASRRRPGK